MRESDKGMKGDHRNISDPTADRKDFIKHVAENAAKEEKKENRESKDSSKEKANNQKH
ncbi:hypothetical protein SHI21_06225 [Bacteriovorax sp. PP10]|uniref:Uncharacterized protein n=1 Tax=Bacteriovorax antarcticus TaxID=3088717 RepID=A0ABU5VS10_9BACT|nr:hypothetical protein [Bacteriovorax sp. PP10]MEA9355786.1 hypothetical protein [Bacteriovorax sp. PP10]